MIIDQLVYGCARLTGGVSAAASHRLIETCLAAGIRHFDTAPSYGMGTAERVLGRALAGRPDVRITAKVGSTRPHWPLAKTCARALKRAIFPRRSPVRDDWTPQMPSGPLPAGSTMSPAEMERSLEISRQALRRDRFDLLLLHEVRGSFLTQDRMEVLERAQAGGLATSIGWSTGAVSDGTTAEGIPSGWTVQAGLSPAAMRGEGGAGVPHFVHSVVNTTLFCQRRDKAFARELAAASALIPPSVADGRSALIAAAYARLHALWPDRNLIFASIDPRRLAAFLAAVEHLDRQVGPAEPATS